MSIFSRAKPVPMIAPTLDQWWLPDSKLARKRTAQVDASLAAGLD